jgi:hypothetical protein
MFCPGSDSDPRAVSFRLYSGMADRDPALERLLKVERLASERYERLRGYPGEVQAVALASLLEASEAVREYRSKHP